MFSSNNLISYVFANDQDTYYADDLLSLNLEQYLWKSLRRDYHTVYFLRGTNDGLFTVRTFGDKDAAPCPPPAKQSRRGPTNEEAFGNWMLHQLCLDRNKAVAFICPMTTFCRVFSRDAWAPVLKQLAHAERRTGIIVLTASPYAEDSRELLLNSPVFDLLNETAVTESRQGMSRPLYAAIRSKKPRHFLCLNAFTKERVRDLLIHVYAADPVRPLPRCGLDVLAEHLAAYLQGTMPMPEPLAEAFPSPLYLTYANLYDQLCSRSVWDQVLDCVQHPLRDRFPESDVPCLSILRAPKCYGGRCLNLRLPSWVCGTTDFNGRHPEDILLNIRNTVSAPGNRPDSPQIAASACQFLDHLDSLAEGDCNTYLLLLQAVEFCTEQIHLPADSAVDSKFQEAMHIADDLKFCIEQSTECFKQEQNLKKKEPFLQNAGGYTAVKLEEAKKNLKDKRADVRDLWNVIQANMLGLVTSGTSNNRLIRQIVDERRNKLEENYDFTDCWD